MNNEIENHRQSNEKVREIDYKSDTYFPIAYFYQGKAICIYAKNGAGQVVGLMSSIDEYRPSHMGEDYQNEDFLNQAIEGRGMIRIENSEPLKFDQIHEFGKLLKQREIDKFDFTKFTPIAYKRAFDLTALIVINNDGDIGYLYPERDYQVCEVDPHENEESIKKSASDIRETFPEVADETDDQKIVQEYTEFNLGRDGWEIIDSGERVKIKKDDVKNFVSNLPKPQDKTETSKPPKQSGFIARVRKKLGI